MRTRIVDAVAESRRKTEDSCCLTDETPTMSARKLIVSIAALFVTWSFVVAAADTTGLPEAFDAGWQGQNTCELMYETDEVRVGRCTFPPGIGHERHYHVPHFGYVLEGGTLSITNEQGEVRVVETITGGTWATDEITVHNALNIGDTTTSYLIIEPKPEGR